MNDIHTVSDNLNFILYAFDTTLSSPMCSFTRGCNGNIELISTLINSELNKIADWLAVNKLSLNVQKTKFMIFHCRQRVITKNDIPCLMINNTLIERVTEFNFVGLTVNEYMNWNSHVKKNLAYTWRYEQAITILAHFSNEIDAWFADPFAPQIWNYKLGLRMGSHIKITKTRPLDYDK